MMIEFRDSTFPSFQCAPSPSHPQSEGTRDSVYMKSLGRSDGVGFLSLPTELISLVAIHVATQRAQSRNQGALAPHRIHQNRRASKLSYLEFKDLFNLAMSCKHLHSICQRIYQKQMVIKIPAMYPTDSGVRPSSGLAQYRYQRKSRGSVFDGICARTIEEQERVANEWSGVDNVNWLFISNQAYDRPKLSDLFYGLITSTARLVKAFTNLRYLCLSRLDDETILMCLERGVGERLDALSITLSEADESESGVAGLEDRIKNLTSLSNLKGLQINDIEPTWTGLINKAPNLQDLSLHISSFSSSIISSLRKQTSLKELEIFGGLSCPSSGRRLVGYISQAFPMVEVMKLGVHFQETRDEEITQKKDYSVLISSLKKLRRFVFNHANLPTRPQFSTAGEPLDIQLERFFDCSRPYLERCGNLKELVSVDFSDRVSTTGIVAKKLSGACSKASAEGYFWNCSLGNPRGDLQGHRTEDGKKTEDLEIGASLRNKWQVMKKFEEGGSAWVPILMYKIPDVREQIMLPFESRWIRLGD